MKKMNSMAILLSACLVFSGCGMTNTVTILFSALTRMFPKPTFAP